MWYFKEKEFWFLISLIFSTKKIDKNTLLQLDLKILTKISSEFLIIPLMYSKLELHNLKKYIDKEFIKYIKQIYELNLERNNILIKEINEISDILNRENINHVYIKGASLIISDAYEVKSQRMIGDIDILVEDKDIKRSLKLLTVNNYRHNFEMPVNKRHLPRLINEDKNFAIEIHSRISEYNLDIEKSILKNKVKVYKHSIPSKSDMLIINIYNDQLNDKNLYKMNFSIRSFYDSFSLLNQKEKKFENRIFQNYFMMMSKLKIYIPIKIKSRSVKIRYFIFFRFKTYRLIEKKILKIFLIYKWRISKLKSIFNNKLGRNSFS